MTEADEILTPPCIYQTICGDCAGRPEAIRIHLNSGEVIRLANVVDVDVTEEKIILRPAGRAAVEFDRDDVYYAGCARCLPPFLS